MIFYGTRASNISNGQIINVECPHCQANTSMIYSVFGKYTHIYWIPLFPVSKITIAECNSCKKTFEYKELPETIKTKFVREKEKSPVSFPVWMFSGCFIILALVGYGFYDSYQTDINEADYIKNPKVGDVYYYKLENGHFTTLRVDKTNRTEVYITINDYEIDLESDINSIDVAKNYTTSKDTVQFLQLQDYYKNEEIISIIRN
jgi:hypothetical protein